MSAVLLHVSYASLLAGRLYKSKHLRKRGEIRYNGHSRREFNMARTVALVDQIDQHIANLTVRETLEFAYICQVRLRPAAHAALLVHTPSVACGGSDRLC